MANRHFILAVIGLTAIALDGAVVIPRPAGLGQSRFWLNTVYADETPRPSSAGKGETQSGESAERTKQDLRAKARRLANSVAARREEGRLGEAITAAEQLISVRRQLHSGSSRKVAQAFREAAMLYQARGYVGDLPQSLDLLQKALQTHEASKESRDRAVAEALFAIGRPSCFVRRTPTIASKS